MLISISARPKWREKEERGSSSSSVGWRQGREESEGEGGVRERRGEDSPRLKDVILVLTHLLGSREGDALIACFFFVTALKGSQFCFHGASR